MIMIYLHRRLAIVAIAAAALLAGCSSHHKVELSGPRTRSASTSLRAARIDRDHLCPLLCQS